MAGEKKNITQSLFDILIGELIDSVGERSPLDLCLSGDRKAIAAIPLRYRLIALGFVQHLSLEDVNSRLERTAVPGSMHEVSGKRLSSTRSVTAFPMTSGGRWKKTARMYGPSFSTVRVFLLLPHCPFWISDPI